MQDSPLILDIVIEAEQRMVLKFLGRKFGEMPDGIRNVIEAISTEEELDKILMAGDECQNWEELRTRIGSTS
jgi:hypothetical protein